MNSTYPAVSYTHLVVGVILFIGFEIMQVNYSALLAILIAFLDFLPVFGTGTAIWPWAVYKVLSGDYKMTIMLLVLYGVTPVSYTHLDVYKRQRKSI